MAGLSASSNMLFVSAAGGIPEFDTSNLFFCSDSPSSPVKEKTPRDFEMELHRRLVNTSEVSLPTHSDDIYCGRRSPKSLGSEPYAKKVKDIKEEIARVSKADRQLVRPEGWRAADSRPWSSRSAADFRNGSKSSKMIENDKDDWRMPKESRAVTSPNDESSIHAPFEPGSFRKALRKHLNQNSPQESILAFLRPILEEDDLTHRRLSLCLATVVGQTLKDDSLMDRALGLLESLQLEDEFQECLAKVITQCHTDCIQKADFKILQLRLTSFAELLAQLLLRFPDKPRIVECALQIADYWIASRIKNTDEQRVQQIYVSCVKNFICVVAQHSVSLVRQELAPILNAVRDMLVSELQPRSVKEVWLDLLLYVERKETEIRMRNDTFSQIAIQSQLKKEGSVDYHDVSKILDPSCSYVALSPTNSSASHSSFLNSSTTSLNESRQYSPANQSLSLDANAASLSESIKELQPKLQDRSGSESAKSKPCTRKPPKKKGLKTMSLQSFCAIPDAPSARERTPDRAIFREDLLCVMCGGQDGHTTSDCPDHKSKFIL